MTLFEESIYQQLQLHLNKLPIGFPATKSGVEIRILKYLFTPEEAQIALCLSLTSTLVPKIQRRLRKKFGITMELGELESKLEQMFLKGNIGRSQSLLPKKAYKNAQLVIGMYEYQVNHLKKELITDMEQYFAEEFGQEFFGSKPRQLRISPHAKAITPKHRIALYDDLREFVRNTSLSIQVANCVCKQAEALMGHPCKRVKNYETCIMFDSKSWLAKGHARNITKEECLALLDKAETDGLVLQPGNAVQLFNICCCCECCGILQQAKKFPKPAELFTSNYYAIITPENCVGCGTCAERCILDAPQEKGGIYEIDLNRCIGCGLCVSTCESSAVSLVKKTQEFIPPKNQDALYLQILKSKIGNKKATVAMLKLLLGLQL